MRALSSVGCSVRQKFKSYIVQGWELHTNGGLCLADVVSSALAPRRDQRLLILLMHDLPGAGRKKVATLHVSLHTHVA